MSDDRFRDPNTFKRPPQSSGWDGMTLEDWLYQQFDKGKEFAGSDEVKAMAGIYGRERIVKIYNEWKLARGKK